jgi:uncharacterized membrane protein YgdD (TMEM256/DUF423 family)
MEEEKV